MIYIDYKNYEEDCYDLPDKDFNDNTIINDECCEIKFIAHADSSRVVKFGNVSNGALNDF